jgi:hypothetical protein
MPLISTKWHGVLDYAGGAGSLAAPKLLRDRRAAAILAGSGLTTLAASALTDYELGIRRRLPMPVHLLADAATGALLLTGGLALRRRGARILDWGPVVLVGVSEIAGAALTERRPGDRPAGGIGSSQAFAPAPPPPIPTPPSAAPQTEPDLPVVEDGATTDDVFLAEEEAAAAAAAGRIGGTVEPQGTDPAMEPVLEAGGGEQDGWELTEAELVENATHGDGRAVPQRDAFGPEVEADEATVVYGEADDARPQPES